MNGRSAGGHPSLGPAGLGAGVGSNPANVLQTIQDLFRADFAALFATEGGLGLLSEDGYNPLLVADDYTLTGGAPYVRNDTDYAGGVLGGPGGASSGTVTNKNGGLGVAGEQYLANPRNQAFAAGTLSAIASNPDASTFIYLAAFSGANDDVSLVIRGGTSTSVLQLESNGTVSGTGNTRQACSSVGTLGSGIVVGAANFYRLVIGFDPNSGLFKAGVNGVLAKQFSPATTMPTEKMAPFFAAATNPVAIPNIHRCQGMWWAYGL